MIIIVCGSREAEAEALRQDYWDALSSSIMDWHGQYKKDLIIVHGNCRGVDKMAGRIAKSFGIGVASVDPDWTRFKQSAGPIRNRWMLLLRPDLVAGFHHHWPGATGTRDMLKAAKEKKVMTLEITV